MEECYRLIKEVDKDTTFGISTGLEVCYRVLQFYTADSVLQKHS